ncbi:MAG: hypothetical protein DRJ51_08330 [Thermoprotei archaeon]|nr:MAG: hypothetical protein DRJ51_08330 [Thermoprotei archaeon]
MAHKVMPREEIRRGMYMGRFQPLHQGHYLDFRDIIYNFQPKKLLIAIVVRPPSFPSEVENPFTPQEVRNMIFLCLEELVRRYGHHNTDVTILSTNKPEEIVQQESRVGTIWFIQRCGEFPYTSKIAIARSYKMKFIVLPDRGISANMIRSLMAQNVQWEHLVPPSVTSYIKRIEGADRIKTLSRKLK